MTSDIDPLLSVFPCATDAETMINLSLSAIIGRIRSHELKTATAQIAADFAAAGGGAAGKRAIDARKKRLPAVSLAGVFARRANAAWRHPSGLVQFDLDHLTPVELTEARARLLGCPWVACLWVSPSGAGLKGAVRVPGLMQPDPSRYTLEWRNVSRWLASLGLVNDPTAKDCARLAFLAHDPEAYHNPEAVVFPLEDWAVADPVQAPPSRSQPRAVSESQAERRALAYVQRMPPSVEGSNGSAAMVAVVRTLRDGFDLCGPGLWRCLDAWNAQHASPPWSQRDMEHALASVEAEPPQRGRGWLLASEPVRATHGATSPQTSMAWASERLMAERLASGSLRLSLRYIPEGPVLGWRRWDGSTWTASPEPVPVALAAAVHAEAGALITDGLLDMKTARALESTACMRAILAQLQAREPMRFDLAYLDPPRSIAVLGGIFDFDMGDIRPAEPDGPAFLHRCAVDYDPEATHPLWDSVAAHVASMPAGETVQRFLGASLVGLPPDRKLLVLTGTGGDGKGTLLRSCVAALGSFGAVLPAEALSGDGRGAHGHEILGALGVARLAYASEVPPDLDWPLIKAVSGGDPRTTKRMHGRAFTVQPRCWLALATNNVPRVPDAAAADRVLLINWQKPADPDPDIVATIACPGVERDAYLRACLAWLVRGAADFMRDGLGVPDFARPAVEPEGLAGWWSDSLEAGTIRPGTGWTPLQPLRASAECWHALRGQPQPTETALGCFLRSRVGSKRARVTGSRVALYRCEIVDGVGRG